MPKNITVVGTGYVGMSIAALLSREHNVTALDIDQGRVDAINNKESTIIDLDIQNRLDTEDISLVATMDPFQAYEEADFIIVATPTNYDPSINFFDTSSVESVINQATEINNNASIVIKSTVPVGFTASMQKSFSREDIIFSPEFLREGRALHDNFYPSRIIIGGVSKGAKEFSKILLASTKKKDARLIFMDATEAEAVKLFSNNYLALRVAFFNELDNYALDNDLSPRHIIEGVSLDPRIGADYNNPSFGYGGYCLPKDTRQLEADFGETPQALISATIKSNSIRKKFLSHYIVTQDPKLSIIGGTGANRGVKIKRSECSYIRTAYQRRAIHGL